MSFHWPFYNILIHLTLLACMEGCLYIYVHAEMLACIHSSVHSLSHSIFHLRIKFVHLFVNPFVGPLVRQLPRSFDILFIHLNSLIFFYLKVVSIPYNTTVTGMLSFCDDKSRFYSIKIMIKSNN